MIVIQIALIILAGVFNACMDILVYNYAGSIFHQLGYNQFWNPEMSWDNKNTSKLPFSRTILVGFTDGWHLMQLLFHTCWQLVIALQFEGWDILIAFVIVKTLFSAVFQGTYSILKR